MTLDRSFVDRNRTATGHIRQLAQELTDEQLLHPVGDVWTVAICLAHLVFWDRRVMYVMDRSLQDGKLFVPEIDILVNDLSLPLWAAIPPRQAARMSVETAEACDRQLEAFPEPLLGKMYDYNQRWVIRALHRNEHLDDMHRALGTARPGG
jgi:hypothetical protein